MLVTGIDEAGRGALVGPLVLAAVTLPEKSLEELAEIGVQDSKKLTPSKREALYEEIEKRAKDVLVVKIAACKIDKYRSLGVNLDKIEAMHIAHLVNLASGRKIFIDALTANPQKFKKLIESYLTKQDKEKEMIVENYLDESNIAVAAASIVAKVERDREIRKLEKEFGMEIGVGYSHDPRTINFIEFFIKNGKELPSCVRKSWITTALLKEKYEQKTLNNFFDKNQL